MDKIDLKDKKILYNLCQNSRQGFSKIATKVGLSKNAVTYRVERLQKKGIIRKFMPIINLGMLGIDTYDVFIKLRVKPEEEKELLEYIERNKYLVWMIKLSGEWDLLLEIAAKNIHHFSKILSEMFVKIDKKIERYEVHVDSETIKVIPLIEEFFKNLKLPKLESKSSSGRIKIDEKDREILYWLSKNGLMPQYEIAEKIKLSPDAVSYRMKNLEKTGVIKSYIPEVMMKPLDYSEYFIILDLRNPSEEELKRLKAYIVNNKNVEYAFRGATKFEIILFVSVKKPEELDIIIKDFKNEFFDTIIDQRFMLALNHFMFNLFPEGLLEK
jgi:DNA-binding Lrp family transcriptional regulator